MSDQRTSAAALPPAELCPPPRKSPAHLSQLGPRPAPHLAPAVDARSRANGSRGRGSTDWPVDTAQRVSYNPHSRTVVWGDLARVPYNTSLKRQTNLARLHRRRQGVKGEPLARIAASLPLSSSDVPRPEAAELETSTRLCIPTNSTSGCTNSARATNPNATGSSSRTARFSKRLFKRGVCSPRPGRTAAQRRWRRGKGACFPPG